jgi:hypothetical protein
MKMLKHKFVEFMPETLEDGILYVSVEYCTALHKCACGCGNTVVTPITPTDWQLSFDGKTISLSPSIGNWSFDCQSHYWIKNNRVRWSDKWDEDQILKGRKQDKLNKQQYFKEVPLAQPSADKQTASELEVHKSATWRSFWNFFSFRKK